MTALKLRAESLELKALSVKRRLLALSSKLRKGFCDVDLSDAPVLAVFAGFPPVVDPLNEFIFDSFFFFRNVV